MHQKGFSLVEILITTIIAAFLITGIYAVYLSNKKTYQTNITLSHLQENSRIASQFLAHDIRMTGLIGCRRITDINLKNIDNFTAATSLAAWHNNSSTNSFPLKEKFLEKNKPGTDILLVQEMDSNSILATNVSQYKITLAQKTDFEEDENLIIDNCSRADGIVVSSANSNNTILNLKRKNTGFNPDESYKNFAEVGHWHQWIYYVAATNRQDKQGNIIYALYRRDLNGPETTVSELIEGVDNFQVRLYEKNNLNKELNAAQVTNWPDVLKVKIYLLLSSMDSVAEKSQNYGFMGKTYLPKDKKLYREWTETVALRNRLD